MSNVKNDIRLTLYIMSKKYIAHENGINLSITAHSDHRLYMKYIATFLHAFLKQLARFI